MAANRAHLDQYDKGAGYKYWSTRAVVDSIVRPKNPLRHRFSIWDGKTLVGSVNFTFADEREFVATIGYWLGSEFCGYGYATLATKAVVAHLRERRTVHRVVAVTHAENFASQRVLTRAGFTFDRADREECVFSLKLEP
jgi:RimJ/RimL family protein N-acetyltransferase